MATVLMPWRGGCPHRERAFEWVRQRWDETGHNLRICEAPEGPWSKAAAFMPHVADAEGIVIVADADCWVPGLGVASSVAAIIRGADWAVPHKSVHRLTRGATYDFMHGCREPLALAVEPHLYEGKQRSGPYNGIHGGGIVVVRRDVLLEVPIDPRFRGWGGEDTSWRDAMLTLVGEPVTNRDPLFHLWHPPQPRMNTFIGNAENHALRTRYVRARGSTRKMRALVAEATEHVDQLSKGAPAP